MTEETFDQVEHIRTAAAVLRKRAEAATPGPWVENVLGSEGYDVRAEARPGDFPSGPSGARAARRIRVARCGYESWETDRANAEYVATVDPVVGLALAGWLDRTATDLEENSIVDRPETAECSAPAPEALWCDHCGGAIDSSVYNDDHVRCDCWADALAVARAILGAHRAV